MTEALNASSSTTGYPASPAFGYNATTDGHLLSTVVGEAAGGGGSSYGDDIALIDSAEAADGETDYAAVGLGGADATVFLQQTLAYDTGGGSFGHNASSFRQSFDGGGGVGIGRASGGELALRTGVELLQGGSTNSGVGTGAEGAGNGGSTFMLLLEDFGEYFYNYNGSAVSGTTTINSSNITDFDYRTNCTNLTSTSCSDVSEVDHNYWALILILFPILTLFGNILVILSVCRERSLQTVTNYFIVSLAIADLLVAVVVTPFAVYVLVPPPTATPTYSSAGCTRK